jgi:hypothetical protein
MTKLQGMYSHHRSNPPNPYRLNEGEIVQSVLAPINSSVSYPPINTHGGDSCR